MQAIDHSSVAKMKQFGAQSIWNLAWAIATLKYFSEPLIAGLGEAAVGRATELSPQGLSNLV